MSQQDFLTKTQEKNIIEAIAQAEHRTSGEIRIHIEHHCDGEALDRAAAIFQDLGMDATEQKNGVLLYIASEDHKAAVYAGTGIHSRVEDHFWNDVLQILLNHFRKSEFERGIAEAVNTVGIKLKKLFPHQHGDVNELSDEISYNPNK